MTTKKGGKYVYDFPKPSVTVDIVLVDKLFKVLLIKRKSEPFAECWALPGGFVDENEKLADAARRELVEETGVEFDTLEQLYTAGDPGRDPRGWTISVAFFARTSKRPKTKAGDDAREAKWFSIYDLPKMAFDHQMILNRAIARIKERSE